MSSITGRLGKLAVPQRVLVAAAIVALVSSSAAIAAGAALHSNPRPLSRQAMARNLLLHTPAHEYLSSMGLVGLERLAGVHPSPAVAAKLAQTSHVRQLKHVSRIRKSVIRRDVPLNVRVNSPAEDNTKFGSNPDMSTQSETTEAVQGSNVVVGFNDSQQANSAGMTNGFDFTGYAFSSTGTTGGAFTDKGTLPNGNANLANYTSGAGFSPTPTVVQGLGDPWITKDVNTPAGTVAPEYFGTLALDNVNLEGDVGVAKSTTSGSTWTPPVMVDKVDYPFVFNDKEGVAAGRSPTSASAHNVYAAYDGFNSLDGVSTNSTDWDVSVSTNGGASWTEHQIFNHTDTETSSSCNYLQTIGSNPIVDPANGDLYVAATEIVQNSSSLDCSSAPTTYREVVVESTNGGTSFSLIHTIATLKDPLFGLLTGPSQAMRLFPFPYLGIQGGKLWSSWDDLGGSSGVSKVFVASSTLGTTGGTSWSLPIQASPTTSSFYSVQPSLVGDSTGLHIAYYQIPAVVGGLLTTYEANSATGASWASTAIGSTSFPIDLTLPQFDPEISWTYMGDYVGIASATTSGGATQQCISWGDNRDIVTDYMYPAGRHDPDVFHACTSVSG